MTQLVSAQNDTVLQDMYPFLQTKENRIIQYQAMAPFFGKLDSLQRGEIKQLRILHIGDSHLQADIFSGELRRLLQLQYGNAGRGFVFPYKAAHTNGPSDYRSGSYGHWESRRMVIPNQALPIGIGGITLSSSDSNSLLYINLKEEGEINCLFDRVTVFRQPGEQYFDLALGTTLPEIKASETEFDTYKKHKVKSGESLGLIAKKHHTTVSQIKSWNNLRSNNIRAGQVLIVGVTYKQVNASDKEDVSSDLYCIPSSGNDFAATCQLPGLSGSFYLRHLLNNTSQKSGLIYGISLENSKQKGILYHTIGVNGAQYTHYNRAEYFAEQVKVLNPDLIIISLGTNEAFARDLTEEQLYTAIDSLVSRLSMQNPEAVFLLCTQPDSYKGKNKNPRNLMIRETIMNYASSRYTGIWDMNTVLGGYGSMNDWLHRGLSAKDRVHFSHGGYRLQGQLLFNALMNSYEHYRTTGSE